MGCKSWDERGQYNTQVCNTNGFITSFGGSIDGSNCSMVVPPDALPFEFKEYPSSLFRLNKFNIPKMDDDAVMYGATLIPLDNNSNSRTYNTFPDSGVSCGKAVATCTSGFSLVYDNYPTALSFRYGSSDTWFYYLYDLSNNAGISGTPCFWLEEEDINITSNAGTATGNPGSPPSGTPGSPGYDPGGTGATASVSVAANDNTGTNKLECYNCTNFYCNTDVAQIRYSGVRDFTGDVDCPHPTLFGLGTQSKKIMFNYLALSTIAPDGVSRFSVDGVDIFPDGYVTTRGAVIETNETPWEVGEEAAYTFKVFTLETGLAQGFVIRASIFPRLDANNNITGTIYSFDEWLSQGVRYTVGRSYTLEWDHRHPSGATTIFTKTLNVTSVADADIANVAGVPGFDKLRVNDFVNGHRITRIVHSDPEFGYHVAYVSGGGSDFTNGSTYVSSRNHIIKTYAGYGIKTHVVLIGLFEFLGKSVQYTTAEVSDAAPDDYNLIEQPFAQCTVRNGRIDGLATSPTDAPDKNGYMFKPGTGMTRNNLNGRKPELVVTPPTREGGEQAIIEGQFSSSGALTGITIINGGSGYRESSKDRPMVYLANIQKENTFTIPNSAVRKGQQERDLDVIERLPKKGKRPVAREEASEDVTLDDSLKAFVGDDAYESLKQNRELTSQQQYDNQPDGDTTSNTKQSIKKGHKNRKAQTTHTLPVTKLNIQSDPNIIRQVNLEQNKIKQSDIDPVRKYMDAEYDLDYLSQIDNVDEFHKEQILTDKTSINRTITEHLDDVMLPGDVKPVARHKERYIQTVSGSLSDMPRSSNRTKYMMTQYRPDPLDKVNINVQIRVEPVEIGCGHVCPSPFAGNANFSESTTGDQYDNGPAADQGYGTTGFGTTYAYTYTMTGPFGSGCRGWNASGTLEIFHDFTRSAQTVGRAAENYGNPYDID